MRLFVTGGTGFIGSHFLNTAHAAGHEVVALRRNPDSRPRIPLDREPTWLDKSMEVVTMHDLENCGVLVHLAAYGVMDPTNCDWNESFYWNVTVPLQLWQTAHRAGIRRYVICGSCFEYGRSAERYEFIPADAPLEPTGAYHASKAAASIAASGFAVEKKASLTILRPFHVYGEGEPEHRFWPSLRKAAMAGEDFPMTKGAQIRDFIPVEHVAPRFLAAATSWNLLPGVPQIHNVGTGCPQSTKQFAERWWQHFAAPGRLLIDKIPYRPDEIMKYVPAIASLDQL